MSAEMLRELRRNVDAYFASGQLKSAAYWSDKAFVLSGELCDLVKYLQCLMAAGEHDCVIDNLESRQLASRHMIFRWMALSCLYQNKRYDEAVFLAESPLDPKTSLTNGRSREPSGSQVGFLQLSQGDMDYLDSKLTEWKVPSALQLTMGRLYEQLDNKPQAIAAYKQALLADVHCFEAFDALLGKYFLSPKGELSMFSSLPFDLIKDHTHREGVRYLYSARLNKFWSNELENEDIMSSSDLHELKSLEDCSAVLSAKAERLYYLGAFRKALACVEEILRRERLNRDCLPVYICLLVKSGDTQKLFALAHRMVDESPERALSWYAVGAYYYTSGLFSAANRLFQKSTDIDATFGPGWLVLGHSLAAMCKHDQAMTAYLKAARVMEGSHLPHLYIGLEYCLTNNTKLGEHFFEDAYTLAPRDPHVLHEMGVMAYRAEQHESAFQRFHSALDALQNVFGKPQRLPPCWEPLANNLAHACRKLGRMDEALKYHKIALLLSPRSASTLAAIGLTHFLNEDIHEAIGCFHQSLSLKRDAKNVSTFLTRTVDLAATLLADSVTIGWEDPKDVLPDIANLRRSTSKSANRTDSSLDNTMTDVSMDVSDVVMDTD